MLFSHYQYLEPSSGSKPTHPTTQSEASYTRSSMAKLARSHSSARHSSQNSAGITYTTRNYSRLSSLSNTSVPSSRTAQSSTSGQTTRTSSTSENRRSSTDARHDGQQTSQSTTSICTTDPAASTS